MNTGDVMYNIMTRVDSDAWYTGMLLRLNPRSSHHSEKMFLFFSEFFIYMKRWMLAEPIVIIIL